MVNLQKLREEIVTKGFTEEEIAEKLGMSKGGFCGKLEETGNCFTIKEANILVQLLKLEGEEAIKIFFAG
mgnify:CR=1 FL=1